MQVFNGLRDLENHVSAQVFAKVCQSHDLVEQLSTGAELENNVVILPRFRKVNQLDDIGVVEVAHNLDFLEDIRSLSKQIGISNSLALCDNRKGNGMQEHRDRE